MKSPRCDLTSDRALDGMLSKNRVGGRTSDVWPSWHLNR